MLQEKISELKKEIIKDASLVEEMIKNSIKGLVNREKETLTSVIEKNEKTVNTMEIEIDEQCVNAIALYQPEAKDLRTILMILKMNNDLERIGDQAVNIAESGLFLIERPSVKKLIDIPAMADESLKMFHDSISAFINEDDTLAMEIVKRDDRIDGLKEQIIRELITFMSEDNSVIERSMHLIKIVQNLERIGDLATNVCENVLYMVKGRVIKHHINDDI